MIFSVRFKSKQIVSQHHQLKDRFIGPKGLEQQVSNRQVILGFLDGILTVPAFSIEFNLKTLSIRLALELSIQGGP